MQALVTGASGFIGSHLIKRLEGAGTVVHPFSRQDRHNVTDPKSFKPFLDQSIQVVFHLAALTFVPLSWEEAHRFYQVNVLGTQNVLEFCRQSGAKLVFFSSYIYGQPQYFPVDEAHPIAPNNPYAHSKWLGEQLCKFYSDQFDVSVIILRPFNIFGPGQSESFLIPQLIKQLKQGHPLVVQDLRPRRDYLFITDFIDACFAALRMNERFAVYNVASGISASVLEIIALIQSIHGKEIPWKEQRGARDGEILDIVGSSALAARGIWKPQVSLRDGLACTLESTP